MTIQGWWPGPLLCLAMLLGAACAGPQTDVRWTRPGATEADLERDRAACLDVPEQATPGRRGEREQLEKGGNAFMRCMQERGWTQTLETIAE